jgi:hypothetical protein
MRLSLLIFLCVLSIAVVSGCIKWDGADTTEGNGDIIRDTDTPEYVNQTNDNLTGNGSAADTATTMNATARAKALSLDNGIDSECFDDVCLSYFLVTDSGPYVLEDGNYTILNYLKDDIYYPRYSAFVYTNSTPHKFCDFITSQNQSRYLELNSPLSTICDLRKDDPIIGQWLYDNYTFYYTPLEFPIAAIYAGAGVMKISTGAKMSASLKLYVLHEIVHSSTEELELPTWLAEGIAEYVSYAWIGKNHTKARRYEQLELWDISTEIRPSGDEAVWAYTNAGYAIRRFVEKHGEESMKAVLLELEGKIGFGEHVTTKNAKVLDAIRTATGNETLQLEHFMFPD